jgi:hypothetical protein
MKIDYTLPGLLPTPTAPAADASEPTGLSFRSRLSLLRPQQQPDWRELLRLDVQPAGATVIGPPPAPPGLEARDGAAQRAQWNRMLERHADLLSRDTSAGVQRMMALLLNMQGREHDVVARHLATTQE